MNHRFIILKTSIIQIDCPCTKCEGLKKISVKKGSILTITPEKKYVDNLGWYFLYDINKEYQVYININDFEEYYNQHLLCSLFDFDLKLNYLKYKTNKALDEMNELAFNQFTNELKDLNELKSEILEGLIIN